MNVITKGDKLIERLSKSKHIRSVTFVVAFLEATISPVLPEAFLIVVLAYRKDISWKLLSMISALGSSFGALAMYGVGATVYYTYGTRILQFLHGESVAGKAKILFADNAFMAQFIASLTPLPDRVFSFLAGAFLVSPVIIFVATFLARLTRAAPVAYLSFEYGDEARVYIKRHTKKVTIVVIILIALYILYRYTSN